MDNPKPVHIDGRAGRGKTYCLYPLIGALRKEGKIPLISASSAFAAKNYPGGRTEHFQYGVPVDENNPFLESAIGTKSDRATVGPATSRYQPLAHTLAGIIEPARNFPFRPKWIFELP
ncbi:hypothetical protein EXIGLDRAFT_794561 [Exidia glandulosa HHB12029]|uniref:ATP-dependent DNA helicase n=1 Tax=Exidia glandulosa HHB12029 TaxID=1314781 RepID=A0A165NI51_EXIGL|nr:hypothetical protein EXIGLDRAFT_794561 [Exidia glandulosa HHB12029]